MIPIDLSGKVALVTGVGDNQSFAWFISKALQAASSHRLVFAVHPRMIRIVEGFLTGDAPNDLASRTLPYGAGSLTVEKMLPCDVSYDTLARPRGDSRRSPLQAPVRGAARRLLHRRTDEGREAVP